MAVPLIAVMVHVLSAVVWVGGMFFALLVLRPASGPLDPPVRLALWRRVFGGFFPWVFAAIVLLLVSGFALFLGGYAAGPHVHVMMAIGIVMMLIFFHLYFAHGSGSRRRWTPATALPRRRSSTRSASW